MVLLTIATVDINNNIKEVLGAIDEIGNMRGDLTFDIDGAVVKVDNLAQREEIGTTFKTPKWAVAYKFQKKSSKKLQEIP